MKNLWPLLMLWGVAWLTAGIALGVTLGYVRDEDERAWKRLERRR